MADGLAARGHRVTLFAAPGSRPHPRVELWTADVFTASQAARADLAAPPDRWMSEHHAYLDLMLRLSRGTSTFDVIHNNSLHHLPVAMSPAVSTPVATVLHTPPLPWLESAVHLAGAGSTFVSVSRHTANAWSHVVETATVPNGVDTDRWVPGPGGGPAVWSGRIVPEKAPHEAIDAARRAGVRLVLAGRVLDEDYARAEVLPRLGGDVTYAGHLSHHELRTLVGRASVALVTPTWDEPYGLVAAEAMASGTPVAGYARGGLAEVVGLRGGRLVAAGDTDALAAAVLEASRLPRAEVRAHAVQCCSRTAMLDAYETVYRDLVLERLAS